MGRIKPNLHIRQLKDAAELVGFTCGIMQMDRFVKDGFRYCVESHLCTPYGCYDDAGKLVAFFALSFDALDLDSDDKEDLRNSSETPHLPCGYDVFWEKSRYPALEITYLAVAEQFQRKGIGYAIFDAIVTKARTQNLAGCQFITVNALHAKEYSAVGFYYKCGFVRYGSLVVMNDIVSMYFTLYPENAI